MNEIKMITSGYTISSILIFDLLLKAHKIKKRKNKNNNNNKRRKEVKAMLFLVCFTHLFIKKKRD